MTSYALGSTFDAGLQLPNYVNGRLLTAEDLATERDSLLTRDTWVGQAAGPGVVSGLWVTGAATTVTVAPGLGFNRRGDPIHVPAPVSLPLSAVAARGSSVDAGRFGNCGFATPGGVASVSDGAYVLTAAPACQLQGSSPLSAAPSATMAPACTARWDVEGVAFKAISLSFDVNGPGVTSDNRQSRLAHWCFGTDAWSQLGADPFTFPVAFRGLDQVDPADLTPADLPLAVFTWIGGQLEIVDNWSARRRPTRSAATDASWGVVIGDERFSEAQARFLQFQNQVDRLVQSGAAGGTQASGTFAFLPPAGFLPLRTESAVSMVNRIEVAANATVVETGAKLEVPASAKAHDFSSLRSAVGTAPTATGFDLGLFFDGLPLRYGGVISWDVAEFTLRRSWSQSAYPTAGAAVSGNATANGGGPPDLLVCFVWENLRSASSTYVFFATALTWLQPIGD